LPAASSEELAARAGILRRAFASFVNFCALLTVKDKSGRYVPFVLNSVQRTYLAARTAMDIILKPRQVGMTTLLLALDIFHFLTKPGVNVTIVCQSKDDNKPQNDLCTEIDRHFERLESMGVKIEFSEKRKGVWKLATGASLSVIVAGASPKSADKIGRSGTIHYLHATEIAFWDIPEMTWNALKQCVPPAEFNPSVVIESTPNGASGLYFEEFKAASEGRTQFKSHFFPWFEQREYRTPLLQGEEIVPINALEERLEPEQIKWYRRMCEGESGHLAQQEYPSDPDSCFLTQGRSFFDAAKVLPMVAAALHKEPLLTYVVGKSGLISRSNAKSASSTFPQLRSIRIFRRPEKGREYVLSLDPSEGVGLDASGGAILERGTGKHCASIWGQYKTEELAMVAARVAKEFNHAQIAFERNNHGQAVRVALMSKDIRYGNVFYDHDGKMGWLNTLQSRTFALDCFEQAVRLGHFTTDDLWLLREMKDFIVTETASGKTRADHERGKHDDLLFSNVIGWSVISRKRTRRDAMDAFPIV
jgi:hypothetical protein